jgi:hypothetical protein
MEFDLGEATNPSCEALQLSITTHYGIVDPSMHNKATNYVRFIKSIHETFLPSHCGCFHYETLFPIVFVIFSNSIF